MNRTSPPGKTMAGICPVLASRVTRAEVSRKISPAWSGVRSWWAVLILASYGAKRTSHGLKSQKSTQVTDKVSYRQIRLCGTAKRGLFVGLKIINGHLNLPCFRTRRPVTNLALNLGFTQNKPLLHRVLRQS